MVLILMDETFLILSNYEEIFQVYLFVFFSFLKFLVIVEPLESGNPGMRESILSIQNEPLESGKY